MKILTDYLILFTAAMIVISVVLYFFGTLLPNSMVKVGRDEANQMRSEQINHRIPDVSKTIYEESK